VVVGIDAELDESSVDDVVKYEETIVSQSRALLPASSQDQTQHKKLCEHLKPLGSETRLIVMQRANSIALCFICMTLAALMGLRDQWRRGQLKRTVESVFTFLAGIIRKVRVKRLCWSLNEYERCLEFFSSVTGQQTV